ncbi:MAG: efflux RND transporter permease subunit, partial [Planctomycetales bacterium]|nr:efflux RND transporter permease subunit [Planctomycetales bacterium]
APATGQVFWYTVEGSGYDLGELRVVQDWQIKNQLAGVEGVAEVASVGGFTPEFQISIDPLALASNNLSVADVERELTLSTSSAGGQVLQSTTAEFFVRSSGGIGFTSENGDKFTKQKAINDLESLLIPGPWGQSVRLKNVARVHLGPAPRRGMMEKDGSEVVGGVVMMRYGENPLALTRRIKDKIINIQPGLPPGVRIVPGYDRTLLITSAVGTVTRTLVEAIATATICVLVVLLHFRTSLIITITLPLAVLASFLMMWILRILGVANVETNIISLAGLAISIGVLVDSSIVMAENVMHRLHGQFGSQPVRGDVRAIIIPACQQVGRPIFFAVLIMLLSFLPVFALGGLEGKMFRPLAVTKSFALAAVAILSITLVPALCTFFVRGRLRSERESWLVRGLIDVYLPLLRYLLDFPAAMAWLASIAFLLGAAALGYRWSGYPALLLAILAVAIFLVLLLGKKTWSRLALAGSLLVIALVSDRQIKQLPSEFLTPLDEGTVMDMPITVPRASIRQSGDDLKARDMVLCRFPEVEMVMGKAGRADTPADPAPMDMIETMVSFRDRDFWPQRKLRDSDARAYTSRVITLLASRGLVELPADATAREQLLEDAAAATLARFDGLMREIAWQRNQEHQRELMEVLLVCAARETLRQAAAAGVLARETTEGDVVFLAGSLPKEIGRSLSMAPSDVEAAALARAARTSLWDQKLLTEDASLNVDLWSYLRAEYRKEWRRHIRELNQDLAARGPGTFVRIVLEDLINRLPFSDRKLAAEIARLKTFRAVPSKSAPRTSHHGTAQYDRPEIDPLPLLDGLQSELTSRIAGGFTLWQKERADLVGFGKELDQAVQMPGWTNVWTMPIQNRVDMLATGVNTTVGIRVLGDQLEDVVAASEQVAAVLRQMPGAVDVVADPVRGKGYLDIRPDLEAATRLGVSLSDIHDVTAIALGGKQATMLAGGRLRHPVRICFPAALSENVEAIRRLPILARDKNPAAANSIVALGQVAQVRITQGPASVKSENGLLRNYVRLNVKERDPIEFVRQARQVVAQKVSLPHGIHLEWTGQFEHQVHARNRLILVVPVVIGLILVILYFTYRDLADALLVVPAIAGAMAGGLFLQWLLGYPTSITIAIGYIACLGMAASTGIIMLVYLRESVEHAGGLENMTLLELKEAVLRGAVHRLRPKLLTEATTIIGLAPMLWATGVGSEVIRPMAAPVLGGILIADELIDLLLPVMFYWVRRWRWHRLHPEQDSREAVRELPLPAASTDPHSQECSA